MVTSAVDLGAFDAPTLRLTMYAAIFRHVLGPPDTAHYVTARVLAKQAMLVTGVAYSAIFVRRLLRILNEQGTFGYSLLGDQRGWTPTTNLETALEHQRQWARRTGAMTRTTQEVAQAPIFDEVLRNGTLDKQQQVIERRNHVTQAQKELFALNGVP